MNERVKFVASYLEKNEPFLWLCERYGVSRKTGYKWVARYESAGVGALEERSRAPLSHPHAVTDEVVENVLRIRKKHPRWGPRKLRVILRRQYPQLPLPAPSTIGEILRKNGLTRTRRRIRRSSPYGDRLGSYDSPNAVWCADFKGHFPVGGDRCHPLTISDGFSRYLLACQALRRPLYQPTRKVFESVFREVGLPQAIRTDNGAPFSTLAPGGLSRLSVWWIRLGIHPERILPGRPEQNGRHERMHRTLKSETAKPPRSSFRAQQRALDQFRSEYNEIRPHEALGQQVPASLYRPSLRAYPRRLPEIDYPDHFQVRRTYPNGMVSFGCTQWYISGCLVSERIGLEEVDDDRWKVYFGPIALGLLDVRNARERGSRAFGLLVPLDGQISRRRRYKRRAREGAS
ncbi:MAG TPA: IS481 family transposase [Vicinamibacteria bacterium]|nr:IS481 family transposase [Vicinamibacteria bacterium]